MIVLAHQGIIGFVPPTISSMLANHPASDIVNHLRATIAAAHADIHEAIKWNSPSFYYLDDTRHFATFNLRSGAKLRDHALLVLHVGSKPNKKEVDLKHPLLTWLGPKRATITVHSRKEAASIAPALTEIVRAWIQYL